jgi:hypothetical protein
MFLYQLITLIPYLIYSYVNLYWIVTQPTNNLVRYEHGLIYHIDTKASSKTFTCKETLRVYLSEAPSPHMTPPPPPSHCIRVYLHTYSYMEGGRGGGRVKQSEG